MDEKNIEKHEKACLAARNRLNPDEQDVGVLLWWLAWENKHHTNHKHVAYGNSLVLGHQKIWKNKIMNICYAEPTIKINPQNFSTTVC